MDTLVSSTLRLTLRCYGSQKLSPRAMLPFIMMKLGLINPVPKGNGPVCHDEVGPDQPTLADLYRMIEEHFDKLDRKLDELTE